MNNPPTTSVIDFVEDLFSEEKIQAGHNPVGPLMDERDKTILSQKVPVNFVQAIAEGKTPDIDSVINEKKQEPVATPKKELVIEDVRTIQECVQEFKLVMAQARGLLEEMTTCGMIGVNMGPAPKDPKKALKKKAKKSTKDIVESILNSN